MPAQITILLALTAGLFDPVLLERTPDAERAVQEAAAAIPEDVSEPLVSADSFRAMRIVKPSYTSEAGRWSGSSPSLTPSPNWAVNADGRRRNPG
ncbi:MAG: hypothetical protein WBG92_07345 [Thiohalocapsa sp.]